MLSIDADGGTGSLERTNVISRGAEDMILWASTASVGSRAAAPCGSAETGYAKVTNTSVIQLTGAVAGVKDNVRIVNVGSDLQDSSFSFAGRPIHFRITYDANAYADGDSLTIGGAAAPISRPWEPRGSSSTGSG